MACHIPDVSKFFVQLIAKHGAEADRHLFRCLLSHIDFSGDGKSSGKDLYQVCMCVLNWQLLCCLEMVGVEFGMHCCVWKVNLD